MTATTLRARIDVPAAPIPSSLGRAAANLAQHAPYRGPTSPTGREQARLTGKLPEWLRGDLVRVGPFLGATPHWAPAHLFDALGLSVGFELSGDRVGLRWAVLGGEHAAAAARGKVPFAQFGSPNQRGPLTRLFHPIPDATDNTNVNVVRMGDELVALTETAKQHVLDPATLQVRGRVQYRDKLRSLFTLAHPITIADTITNLGMKFGRKGEVVVFDHQANSRVRTERARWSTDQVPYIHSFGLTPNTTIIIDHPLRVRPFELLWSNAGLIDSYEWNPARPARLIAIDRASGRVHAHETEPLFCFHTVHAFETPSTTVLDLIAYDDAEIISALSVPRLSQPRPDIQSRLLRLSIDRSSGRVERRVLSDVSFDFPQVDWERAGDGPEQIVFGAVLGADPNGSQSKIVRVETESGATRSFSERDYVFGEPYFVGAPDRRREGDGVLLATGASERGAALFVLDATTLSVIARADVATHLPLALHGTFVPA